MTNNKIYKLSFSKVYLLLIAETEKKGRTRNEIDEIHDELEKGKSMDKILRK